MESRALRILTEREKAALTLSQLEKMALKLMHAGLHIIGCKIGKILACDSGAARLTTAPRN